MYSFLLHTYVDRQIMIFTNVGIYICKCKFAFVNINPYLCNG